MLTQTLKTALQLVDVRVLDHLVVTANGRGEFRGTWAHLRARIGAALASPLFLSCSGAVCRRLQGQPKT
jgi:hypothetical protein